MNDHTFSVMDMAASAAEDAGVDVKDLFKREEPKAEPPAHEPAEKKKEWVPDADLLDGLDDVSGQPLTYAKDEIITDDNEPLKNIAEEDWKQEAASSMDELHRIQFNVEEAKKRLGIKTLQIPEGPMQVNVYNAAADTDFRRAQENLRTVLTEYINKYPEFIKEWMPGHNSTISKTSQSDQERTDGIVNEDNIIHAEDAVFDQDNVPESSEPIVSPDQPLSISIDKSNVPEVSWTDEELDKIRKARIVELNIVEGGTLEIGDIEDLDDNAVDEVISKYVRKNNDVTAVLPASRYRCTFRGLSYPEVIDLDNSNELHNIDGERKKWSICFEHMMNPSIGPWRSYRYYIDPLTKKKIEVDDNTVIPEGITDNDIVSVSKFEDFLMHTSFLDLDFMLWKILCATSMDREIISIKCHAKLDSGAQCGNNYDWIYDPNELLEMDSVSRVVAAEMEGTGTAVGHDEIWKNYMDSFLKKRNTARLHNSGLLVEFGHRNAYEYLDEVYPAIKALESEEKNNPTLASRGLNSSMLAVVKCFLVKQPNGKWGRISKTDAVLETIRNMDEVDWQTLGELVRLSISPYQFRYSLRGIVCPKCKTRSKIRIDDLTDLLFIVARSLQSVQVMLTS